MNGSERVPTTAHMIPGPAEASRALPTASRESLDDPERLRRMVDDHFEFVWRCLRRFGVPARDADDATQEVFLVAHRKLSLIDEGAERGFLFQTAARIASHALRAIRRRRESEEPPDDDLADSRRRDGDRHEPGDAVLARRLLDEIMSGLPNDLRAVFILFELEGLPTDEIAKILDIPVGTAASRLRRAREQFHALVRRRRAHDRFFFGAKP